MTVKTLSSISKEVSQKTGIDYRKCESAIKSFLRFQERKAKEEKAIFPFFVIKKVIEKLPKKRKLDKRYLKQSIKI